MHASASALITTTARATARDTEAVPQPMTAITVPVSFGFDADALGTRPVYASPSGRENRQKRQPASGARSVWFQARLADRGTLSG
jgi:hypothetical protein